jgi:hypothetical protein
MLLFVRCRFSPGESVAGIQPDDPAAAPKLHRGLIAQGEQLLNRCQGWTDDMTHQRGWAPEVG